MDTFEAFFDRWRAGEIVGPPIAEFLGIWPVDFEQGVVRVAMNTGPRLYNPLGTLHGGVLCDLADVAMGTAMASTLIGNETFTTAELNICFFQKVTETCLTATGKVIRRGKTTSYIESEVTDAEGRLVAKASSLCIIKTLG